VYDDVMTFGKYKGRRVQDIPSSYLEWVLRECQSLEPWLRRAIQAEVCGRGRRAGEERNRASAGPAGSDGGSVVPWEPVVREWYRTLARRYHPDMGGTTEQMQAINYAHDELRRLLGVA
jgi:hypothetical protein